LPKAIAVASVADRGLRDISAVSKSNAEFGRRPVAAVENGAQDF
jgi:hypothetical protein